MKVVLDSSVIAKLFLEEADSDKAQIVLRQIQDGKVEAHSLSLAYFEVLNVLTKKLDSLPDIQAQFGIFGELVEAGGIVMHEASFRDMSLVAELANTAPGHLGYISVYDASFHILAKRLGAVFLTADISHFKKTKDTVGSVELLSTWTADKADAY